MTSLVLLLLLLLWQPNAVCHGQAAQHPEQRPIRGQLVNGRYRPFSAALLDRSSSGHGQSRALGTPDGRTRRGAFKGLGTKETGEERVGERRCGQRTPAVRLTERFPTGVSGRRRERIPRRPRERAWPGGPALYSPLWRNLNYIPFFRFSWVGRNNCCTANCVSNASHWEIPADDEGVATLQLLLLLVAYW